MSLLEKIIYVADLTSDDREYPDIKEVRMMAEESLEKLVFADFHLLLKIMQEKTDRFILIRLKPIIFLQKG